MHRSSPPGAPLPSGAAAVAQWASRAVQPRRSQHLLSRGRSALAALRRRSVSAMSAGAAIAAIEAEWGVHGESTNVVHLTGLRLYADEARKDARGVSPAANVAKVLAAAAAAVTKPPPAAIIITGDVAADRSAAAYALAKRLVRDAFPKTTVLFMPGHVNAKLPRCRASR
jgi:hypothetical protein